jgi:Flp pilus assembly protein TadG
MVRLARDTRGHAFLFMAAFLIPLIAFSGSAIDAARLYTVKTRLQQACDAGVLAGRKVMDTGNTSSALDSNAVAQAQIFFKNNFREGWFKTTNVVLTPTKVGDNEVQGVATAKVPMTIMTMFGQPTRTLSVSCIARYDITDLDIIFVLDTTGSMACLPSDSDSSCSNYVGQQVFNDNIQTYKRPSGGNVTAGYAGSTGYYVPEKVGSRIAALRTAVIDFYATLAGKVDPSAHVRYGFVTYTSTVNAGQAIMSASPSYMIGGVGNGTTNWTYQSRRVISDYTYPSPDTVSNTNTGVTQDKCNSYKVARSPALVVSNGQTTYTYDPSTGKARETVVKWTSDRNGTCVVTNNVYGPHWLYTPVSYDVSSYLTASSVNDPSEVVNSPSSWQGCIEEASTSTGTITYDPNNPGGLPNDLNPDLVPNSLATSWKPMWSDVVFARNYNPGSYTYGFSSTANAEGDLDPPAATTPPMFGYMTTGLIYHSSTISNFFAKAGYAVCGKPIQRLATLSQSDVSNYVNATDFRAIGGTYHDTGMIWGVRLLSRAGIFKGDSQAWTVSGALRPLPTQVIVFLTDGDMAPTTSAYGMYGVEYFDRRVTGGSFASQTDYHNSRFLAECAKAKAMKINVWTVSIAPSVTTQMQQCASSTAQALYTTSGSDLDDKFKQIANSLAMLRLDQ